MDGTIAGSIGRAGEPYTTIAGAPGVRATFDARRRLGARRRAGVRAAAVADARLLVGDRPEDRGVRDVRRAVSSRRRFRQPGADSLSRFPVCLPDRLPAPARATDRRRPRRGDLPDRLHRGDAPAQRRADPRPGPSGRAAGGRRGGPAPAGLVPALLPLPVPPDRQPARYRPGAPGLRGGGGLVRRAADRGRDARGARGPGQGGAGADGPAGGNPGGLAGPADATPRVDRVRMRLRAGDRGMGHHGRSWHAGSRPPAWRARAGDRVGGGGRHRPHQPADRGLRQFAERLRLDRAAHCAGRRRPSPPRDTSSCWPWR